MVEGVCDVERVVALVEDDAHGAVEHGLCRDRFIWRGALDAGAGYGGDDAVRIDFADHVIPRVGDVEFVVVRQVHVDGLVERGRRSGAAVAGIAGRAVAGNRRYFAGGAPLSLGSSTMKSCHRGDRLAGVANELTGRRLKVNRYRWANGTIYGYKVLLSQRR